jgi:hypothetical protein
MSIVAVFLKKASVLKQENAKLASVTANSKIVVR